MLTAQDHKITLSQAIAIGQQNYPDLKTGELEMQQAEKLATINYTLPNTLFL